MTSYKTIWIFICFIKELVKLTTGHHTMHTTSYVSLVNSFCKAGKVLF